MSVRWRVAHFLNRSRRFCWTDLVTWALWGSPSLRDCRVKRNCREQRDDFCYCGKLKPLFLFNRALQEGRVR